MKKILSVAIAAILFSGAVPLACASSPSNETATVKANTSEGSVLAEMFKWLNEVYASEESFTEEGFSQFLTEDILFIVNGKLSEKGIAAVTERYNNLKARKAHLEVILPFQEEERVGDKIFVYYLNHGWMDRENPLLIKTYVAGYVDLIDNKIDRLNFISVDVEP